MNKLNYIWLISFSVIGLLIAVTAFNSVNPATVQSTVESDNINYKGTVCVTKTPCVEKDNDNCLVYGEPETKCDHNLLYTIGANMTRDCLLAGCGAITNLSICNSTGTLPCYTPLAADKATDGWTDFGACGLTSKTGTTLTIPRGAGNWSVYGTFTSTCDAVKTNVTRLANASGSIFAGSAFTEVTLQTNDQLTINWTLQVS